MGNKPALPWRERVPMLSINPDAATRDDVASLAEELMLANHKLARAKEAEMWVVKLEAVLSLILSHLGCSAVMERYAPTTYRVAKALMSEYAAWKKSGEGNCATIAEDEKEGK